MRIWASLPNPASPLIDRQSSPHQPFHLLIMQCSSSSLGLAPPSPSGFMWPIAFARPFTHCTQAAPMIQFFSTLLSTRPPGPCPRLLINKDPQKLPIRTGFPPLLLHSSLPCLRPPPSTRMSFLPWCPRGPLRVSPEI